MAHKSRRHSSNRSPKDHNGSHHGEEKHDKKKRNEKHKEKAVAQGNDGPGNPYVGATWSSPTLDPSGNFVYIAMEMPNGEFRYRIAGPQAYQSYVTPSAYPEPENYMPNPSVDQNYDLSNSNTPYVPNDQVSDSWQARSLEPVEPGQIRIETYPNNDINIVTARTSEESTVRDMVLVVQTDSNVDITPVASRSTANRSDPRRQVERRSHTSRRANYDKAVMDRRALSRLKVSDWLSHDPSHDTE